jgi:hypothetical protein
VERILTGAVNRGFVGKRSGRAKIDQRKTGEESGQKISSQNERAALDEKQAKESGGLKRASSSEARAGRARASWILDLPLLSDATRSSAGCYRRCWIRSPRAEVQATPARPEQTSD